MIENSKLELQQNFNRSFARRIGKKLSDYKKNLLAGKLPKYLFLEEKMQAHLSKNLFLEIGFGMGEHLFKQAKTNPNNFYIGAEVYLNGVANFLKLAFDLNNFMLWPDDLDIILPKIADKSLNGIYILFPDPWHKRRYLKKRFVNKARLDIFKTKLKSGGFLAFASDIEDYFNNVKELMENDADFQIENKDPEIAHDGYLPTKYHQKAEREGRVPRFIQTKLIR